jgi:hypothetical protein
VVAAVTRVCGDGGGNEGMRFVQAVMNWMWTVHMDCPDALRVESCLSDFEIAHVTGEVHVHVYNAQDTFNVPLYIPSRWYMVDLVSPISCHVKAACNACRSTSHDNDVRNRFHAMHRDI